MRGVDTNVLVRYITFDDQRQSELARQLFEYAAPRGDRLHVAIVTLCELAWTLRGPRYRYDHPAIAEVLTRILETPLFELESRELVARALLAYRRGSADFADFVIGEAARRAGCEDTVTLDRRLAQHPPFTLLE